ncbi:MAG: hypothetical protein LLF99_08650 [Desulfobacteraceae bacterium]|nr:hypothetical protein [Desulfobacteraceae bacterium]
MKIASSAIAMTSDRQSVSVDESSTELTAWAGSGQKSPASAAASAPAWGRDRVSLSGGRHHHTGRALGRERAEEPGQADELEDEDEKLASSDGKLFIMKKIIEALTGRSLRVGLPDCPGGTGGGDACGTQPEGDASGEDRPREGWGAVLESTQMHYEYERTNFSAGGVIQTADGKEVRFTVNLQMTREYLSSTSTTVLAGDAARVDPLVINYSGNAAELTDMKFAFDINTDGKTEDIPFVRSGSGLLALDRNGDGTVGDGSELFGPTTGDGLKELAEYDEDANGWIDESDSVYERLSLWTRDAAGNDLLQGLRATGVGAIYLTGVDTQFDLKDDENALNGQVVQTGLFVSEDGEVGTVQQVDMFV